MRKEVTSYNTGIDGSNVIENKKSNQSSESSEILAVDRSISPIHIILHINPLKLVPGCPVPIFNYQCIPENGEAYDTAPLIF